MGPECLRRNLTSSHAGPEHLLRNFPSSTEDRDADKFGIGLSSSLILQSNRPDEHMSTAICTNTDACKYIRAMDCERDESVQHLFKFHRNSLRIKGEECCYRVSHCCCEEYIPVLSREIPKSIKREEDLSIGNVCQYHVDFLRQKYNFDKHDYAVSNEIGPADCHLSLEGMSGCSNDVGLANGCSGFMEMTGYNHPFDITTADCAFLELFWVEMDTCQNEYLHSALKDGKGENIFNEDEIVRNKVKPRNGESNGKTCKRWIQNLKTYKQRGTKFPCESEEDSGITTPDVSFSTGSIDIKQNKYPSSVELEINNSNPPGGNLVTVETQSGLRIEAENIQLKWQRGIESLTITPSLARTKSKLSIKTPDGNDIRGVHGEEVQIQTQSETICLTPL
ncbi:uncharacterized protein LOC125666320 [Ostrea edulis]|uniref:uncharacterized protein LOC125666320 n=1 Tax=Ostrea edulis TaxID=37623 RepID=UPI0020945E9B|nr:uncharacterized protein LOC125666320 [Ostrea edulis]